MMRGLLLAVALAATLEANPEAGEAGAVIIYAWNEFDEGGWICPTLSEGTARLDAIRKVLPVKPDAAEEPGKTSGQRSAPAPE